MTGACFHDPSAEGTRKGKAMKYHPERRDTKESAFRTYHIVKNAGVWQARIRDPHLRDLPNSMTLLTPRQVHRFDDVAIKLLIALVSWDQGFGKIIRDQSDAQKK